MKKVSKMLVVLLALVMAMSISGCGGSDSGKDLVGTWSLDYDLADLLAAKNGCAYRISHIRPMQPVQYRSSAHAHSHTPGHAVHFRLKLPHLLRSRAHRSLQPVIQL